MKASHSGNVAANDTSKRESLSEPEVRAFKRSRVDVDLTIDSGDDEEVPLERPESTACPSRNLASRSEGGNTRELRYELEQVQRQHRMLELEVEKAKLEVRKAEIEHALGE